MNMYQKRKKMIVQKVFHQSESTGKERLKETFLMDIGKIKNSAAKNCVW